MLSIFKDSWNGNAHLWKAFWLVYFVFGIIISLIVAAILSVTVAGFSYATHNNLLMTIVLPYTIYSAICVWRCGKNSLMVWNVLSKIVVVLAVISGFIGLLQVIRG